MSSPGRTEKTRRPVMSDLVGWVNFHMHGRAKSMWRHLAEASATSPCGRTRLPPVYDASLLLLHVLGGPIRGLRCFGQSFRRRCHPSSMDAPPPLLAGPREASSPVAVIGQHTSCRERRGAKHRSQPSREIHRLLRSAHGRPHGGYCAPRNHKCLSYAFRMVACLAHN